MRLRNQAVAIALSLLPIGQIFLLGTITASTARKSKVISNMRHLPFVVIPETFHVNGSKKNNA